MMALHDDLASEVSSTFRFTWETTDGRGVPDAANLRLASNHGTKIDATVLYADMTQSTQLVDTKEATRAAEVYKAFLTCCARIIRANDGVITAYDGDRIMAVYVGDTKNTNAIRTGLKINAAMRKVIRPKYKEQYSSDSYVPGHCVGIDTSKILVARIGVRNDNDLVWVGRAANHAAKLSGLRAGYATCITSDVYNGALDSGRISTNGQNMWSTYQWDEMGKQIYVSDWWWYIDYN